MDKTERERRLLQKIVAIGGLVPVGAGLAGALLGASFTGDGAISISGDSHYRYLSGLLLGLGIVAWSGIPGIETKSGRFLLLTTVVVLGGLARLGGLLLTGTPSLQMLLALVMELAITPAICLWQIRIARLHAGIPTTLGPAVIPDRIEATRSPPVTSPQ